MKALLFATALAILLNGLARAATISMPLVLAQTYDSNLNPLGIGAPIQPGAILRFDVRMSLLNAAVNEDFASITFDINLSPGLEAIDLGSGKWMSPAEAESLGLYSSFPVPPPAAQSYSQYDSNGPSFLGLRPHWSANDDYSPSKVPAYNDLKYITVGVLSVEAANRQYGEPNRPAAGYADQLGSPTLLGSVLVKYNGPGIQTIAVVSGYTYAANTYIDNATGRGSPAFESNSFVGSVITIPEPSTFALFSIGAILFHTLPLGRLPLPFRLAS